uniref:Variant surface glycoprotein 1125.2792 n=1 Tax=Trypanosoma brucei TaxID=5691 RepID=A0A1J0R8S9_9TRYP|nr:variant surface glycoprotein 1125.2792 [Trypanosoma brucei]
MSAQLKTLAEKASQVYEQYTSARNKDDTETRSEINKALREALYGAGVATKKAEDTKTVKSKSDYASSCVTSSPSLTIYGDMLCICGVDINWGADATQVLQQVQGKCPKRAAPKLTANNVDTAIATFGGRVRHGTDAGNTHHFLGKQSAGSCTGVTGQLCVVYDTFYATNSKEGHLAIPWVAQLTTAAAKLREHEAAVVDVKDATAALKQLQAMAWTIYSIPDTDEAPAHQVTPKEQLKKKHNKPATSTKATKLHAKVQVNASGKQKMENLKQKANANLKMEKSKKAKEQRELQEQLDVQNMALKKLNVKLTKAADGKPKLVKIKFFLK